MELGTKTDSAVTVLITDDLVLMRNELAKIISDNGFTIAGEAENGRQAVEMYMSLKPDIVLLDIVMPEMDGLTALRKITRYDPDARVIMCSSMGQRRYLVKAIRWGARDFIVKPFTEERVVSAIEKTFFR